MTDWVRLWHDMPTDPKWRVIAKKAQRPISEVMSVYVFAMVNASANANERGRTHNLFADDIAAALDVEDGHIEAIIAAMMGKVMTNDGTLMGWEKRQPKREDSSADRAKKWREERKRTQANARERPETETELSLANANDGAAVDPTKVMFDTGIALITQFGKSPAQARSWLGKALKECGAEAVIVAIGTAKRSGAPDPIPYMTAILKNGGNRGKQQWQVDRDDPRGVSGLAFNDAFEALGVGGTGNGACAPGGGLKLIDPKRDG